MRFILFVSVLFWYVAAVEDASCVSGNIGGKEEEQVACSFKEKRPSSSVGQGAALSAGVRGCALPSQDVKDLKMFFAAEEDKTFDMLEEIQEGKYAGMKLEKIFDSDFFIMGGGCHKIYFGKEDTGKGADVTFLFAKISDENKSRIADGELDLGKIRYLTLSRNAVELLPMLKIHEDNKMVLLNLNCDSLSELGSLLERKHRFFIGLVDHVWLGDYAINLLTKIQTKEGNEMKTLAISFGSLSKIEPLLESKEKIYLGKTKGPVFMFCENDDTEKKIRDIINTRNVILDSGETGKAVANQVLVEKHQSISGAWQR
ncbi:MAG: uncharacterized protein A8A55_2747 [Amphiamblys sp. WSBS2006]|nr:MAG: uncharacterized protein A8A55_2748 [Amphiamblys sp. WSBS2006]OIR56506.1 MAG: uncharacterized protein A8A55_2747 [Amphiamblys sp. WSBS2006]